MVDFPISDGFEVLWALPEREPSPAEVEAAIRRWQERYGITPIVLDKYVERTQIEVFLQMNRLILRDAVVSIMTVFEECTQQGFMDMVNGARQLSGMPPYADSDGEATNR